METVADFEPMAEENPLPESQDVTEGDFYAQPEAEQGEESSSLPENLPDADAEGEADVDDDDEVDATDSFENPDSELGPDDDTEKKVPQCTLCGKQFTTKNNVLQHMKLHTGEKSHECYYCGKAFTQKSNLTLHERSHTGFKPFQCRYCDKRFSKSSNLRSHETQHTGEGKFACEHCDKVYAFRFELINHLRRGHPDLKGEHHCNVCSKTFEKSDQLATHTECHATKEKQDSENVKPPSREIECSTCQQSLKSEAALRRHMVSHKVTKCTECLESFEDRVAFFAHIASYHADLYPYQCHKPQCGESFKTDLQVAYHLVVHMDSKTDTLFQCNMCLKEFVRKGTLQTHIKTHEGARVKPHECHICLKRFMFHSEMVVHKRCHTGERPFQCKICGQSFTQKGNLSQHQMKHTDSRPFICQVEDCKKSYKYFGDLQSHQRDKHPAENDLVAPTKMNMSELTKKTTTTCKVCGNEKKSDVEHLCLPVGVEDVKPFTCKKCRKSFAKNHELQKHIQQSHMKDLFQCNHCRVTFVTEMLLQEHELASHPSYKCPTCDQAFRSEKECNKHGQIHLLNGDSYHCSACTLVFAGASNLKMHEAREHGLSPFRCKVCVEGFQRASQLKEHEQVHLKDSPHQCVHCFERFLTDADVVTHVLTHMEEMAHVCGKCGEGFKLAKDLKKHQCPAANGDLQLDCTLCDESFDEYRKLEMHIEKAHFAPPKQDNVKSGANRCRVCKRKFESEEEFQIHIVFVHPDSEPQKKRIRSVTKPSPKQGNSSGTTKSSHHKSGHSSGAKKSSQKPAQSPSAKSSQNLIRRTSSGRISTKPRKLRDSDDEEQNSATSPSSSSSSPSLSSARSKSSSSSPSLSSARSKRDLTRKPVVIKTDSPAKREAKRQPGEGWKRLRRMSAADVAEEVTRESPKKRKAADSPGTTTRRGSSPRIAAASNHNAANKNTANKPFKCRHCSMRFVSASKKLGHEKSH